MAASSCLAVLFAVVARHFDESRLSRKRRPVPSAHAPSAPPE
jgi:hypothetical protein